MVEWFWCDSSLISATNWFPSVVWHCWFGHLACNNRPWDDLLCVEWHVKPLHPYTTTTHLLDSSPTAHFEQSHHNNSRTAVLMAAKFLSRMIWDFWFISDCTPFSQLNMSHSCSGSPHCTRMGVKWINFLRIGFPGLWDTWTAASRCLKVLHYHTLGFYSLYFICFFIFVSGLVSCCCKCLLSFTFSLHFALHITYMHVMYISSYKYMRLAALSVCVCVCLRVFTCGTCSTGAWYVSSRVLPRECTWFIPASVDSTRTLLPVEVKVCLYVCVSLKGETRLLWCY